MPLNARVTQDFIWKNFAVSVWLLIAYCVVLIAIAIGNAPEIEERFGPFSARVILWPIAYAIIELLLWVRPFRNREKGARMMAGVVGTLLLLQGVVVPLLVGDLYGSAPSGIRIWLVLYIAASHFAFAVLGRELR